MTTELPPYSVKAMHFSKAQIINENLLDKKNSFSFADIDEIKNKYKMDTSESKRTSMTFKTEEIRDSIDKVNHIEKYITPFHLNTDPQFKSTLPYLMIESFFLVIVMNINETVQNKKSYQFAVMGSVILLAHHIIMDTSVTYLSRWGKLNIGYLNLLMVYSALTILSTMIVWIMGDYKANWIVPKTVMFIWCLFTYYTWQCVFIRMCEYRLFVINKRANNENTIWRSKDNKQKYYQKTL